MSLNLQGKTATIFGATGFLGRYIVARLAKTGVTIRVVTRHPQSAYFLRTCGSVGQIVPVAATYGSAAEIETALAGSDFVVNCLGVLAEGKNSKFKHVHVTVPGWIAQACAAQKVSRFVHISALGVDVARSTYAKTKLAGEQAVHASFPQAIILRPSVIFGPEDNFFNMFAGLAKFSAALPLIGGGKTKFQPVYVGDVASAAVAALTLPATGSQTPLGKIFELGGPEILTLRDVYQRLLIQTRQKRLLITLPWGLARIAAAMPLVPLTGDQVTSLQTDSIVRTSMPVLADLGIQPTALEGVLPTYLDKYRAGGRFADKKRA